MQSGTHMAKKLKATTLENQYGRPIWEDVETGEKHSELSTTFQYKGKWINMPTLHKGKIYTADQLKRFLDLDDSALDGWITSTHESKFEAEQAAKDRSTSFKHTAAKTSNANFQLSDAGFALIQQDPGYINRNVIKAKNDKELAANNKPIFNYKSDIKLEEPVNLTKDLKPNYGEMPGFKFTSAKTKNPKAGFWSADETSDFWQTDAGYEKAIQTWGEKPGWVKPGFRPKKEELDINAIKKWLTPSK